MGDLRMPRINKTMMAGRLTRDAKSEHLPSGDHRVEFGIAVPEGFGDNERPMFFQCQARKACAKFCQHLRKGQPVIVEGRTYQERYPDKNGKPKTATRIVCTHVQILAWDDEKKPDGDEQPIPDDDIPF